MPAYHMYVDFNIDRLRGKDASRKSNTKLDGLVDDLSARERLLQEYLTSVKVRTLGKMPSNLSKTTFIRNMPEKTGKTILFLIEEDEVFEINH